MLLQEFLKTSAADLRGYKIKSKTLKHSATGPQPKPLTAEDAGGAEDAGKSAGRGVFFRVKNRRKLRKLS
jgi:hypothetical protein